MSLRLPSIALAFIFIAALASAKDWRGITPLQSTKSDVIRLLGKPTKSQEGAVYYDLAKEIVVIDFATVGCDSPGGQFGFGWNVPAGRVTIIGIIPKTRMTKEAAGVTSDFKKDEKYGDFVYFTNNDEGIQVEVYHGLVTNIQYQPTAKDESLKCPLVQKCCWDVFPQHDVYGRLTRNEAMPRYQSFIQTVEEFFGRGVVVVKGKNPSQRLKRMKVEEANVSQACRLFKFPIERMLVVDGGYSEQAQTELDVYPIASQLNWILIFKKPDPKSF